MATLTVSAVIFYFLRFFLFSFIVQWDSIVFTYRGHRQINKHHYSTKANVVLTDI